MVKSFGIHAAGIVISNEPIYEHIPIWWKDDEELQPNGSKKKIEKYITQYNMGEVEALGLIKMDILSIDNISILIEACRLVKERHGIDIDPYTIEDGDPKAYKLLEQGLMSGVFQLEGSASVKDLTQRIAPHSIDELSDINALHRPGPLSAGLHETYIQNKNNGYAPDDLPDIVADILKETKWTLIYQETVMNLVSKLAGFSLKEADDVRRAMG
jgi:DNA polymerase-3 subunit alpha